MKILSLSQNSVEDIISEAVQVLQSGGIVVYPTETVYGIGVDATNQKAVSNASMAEDYVKVNDIARNLYTNFLPGPLTVVSKSLGKVARGVESEVGTLGIRIPDYPLMLDIVRVFGKPITATSANASYKKRPYKVQDIFDNISDKQKSLIDLVIDAGELPKHEPSTVVDTTLNQEVVLRQGSLKLQEIVKRTTYSAEETSELGRELMQRYLVHVGYKSIIFALQGDLGAGKTQMTKGIAAILGVEETVDSPTYVIEKEYLIHGKSNSYIEERRSFLYHIDTWRLQNAAELEQMGFIQRVAVGNVFVLEWADRVQDVLERVRDDAVLVWVYF